MIGKTVSHYKIVEELGRGGMGVVYKAEDTKLKRTVALKFLPPSVGADERARFEQEAQSAAHLQHPNICTVYEIDEVDGQAFIAMAYIDGVELKALTAKGPMALDEAVSVAIQVATALEEAHEHEIVHRDIKSANVMINRKGLAKVMDFGLAKRRGRTQITQAGTSLGTIDYMSPEQTRGDILDHRTDVWSFGVMLYEMIAGHMPFRGEFDQAVIYSILNEEAQPLNRVRPEAPPLLSDIVARAMAKKVDDRYASMHELLADLHAVQDEVGVPTGSSVTGAINWAATGRPSTGGKSAATPRPAAATGSRGETAVRPGTFDARAFQIVGGYALLGALVVGALRWVVGRFPVSPNLPEFGMWALLALLPTIAVIAFFRGGANRVRMVGIPATVLAAGALLFTMFGDKDLGAATRTVIVTDENGNVVERVVPKQEFRKRVALFYFDNKSGDPANDWLSYGIAHLARYDLYQDTYVSMGMGFTRPHKEAGFDVPVGSPLAFKKKLGREYHFPYVVTGTFDKQGGIFTVDVALHRADETAPLSQRHYTGDDMFAIVDEMTLQLRRDLGIPEYHIAESTDLPASEIFTDSFEAMESYVRGVNARWQDNDFPRAIEYLGKAVKLDPAFAAANHELCGAHVNNNNGAEAEAAIRGAIQHKYKLPERIQFEVTSTYHELRQDGDAVMANAQRWVSLYPDDVNAHLKIAERYENAGEVEKAIAEHKTVFELSPDRYTELHTIANLYEDIGDLERAEDYLKRYAELFPDKYDSYTWLGAYYARRGDIERARENYRQALVIEPERMFIRTGLAEFERMAGNFDESLRQGMEALRSAQTAQDSSSALRQLVTYYSFRGQAKQALDYMGQQYREERKFREPLQLMVNTLFSLGRYVDAGQPEKALAIAREMEERPAVPWFRSFVAAGYIITYSYIDDPANADEADRHLANFAQWVEQAGMHQLDWVVEFCSSTTLDWRGDTEEALARVARALATIPGDESDQILWMNTMAGTYARKLGRYAQAEEYLNAALKLEPWAPMAHYQLALVYHEQGNIEKAREHIAKAMKVWEDADPGFKNANKARELAELLRSSS